MCSSVFDRRTYDGYRSGRDRDELACLLLPVCAAILGLALYRIGFTLFAVFVLMVVLSFALGDLAGRMAVQPHRPDANSSLNR